MRVLVIVESAMIETNFAGAGLPFVVDYQSQRYLPSWHPAALAESSH